MRRGLAAGAIPAALGFLFEAFPIAPLPRGILATCTARTDASAAEVVEAYTKAYADEPFVHLLPEGQWPQTKSVTGSNAVHLQVTVDEDARRLVAVGAVDNLAKGTGGAGSGHAGRRGGTGRLGNDALLGAAEVAEHGAVGELPAALVAEQEESSWTWPMSSRLYLRITR